MKQFIWMLCGIFVSGLLLGTLSACGAEPYSVGTIATEKLSAVRAAPGPEVAEAPAELDRDGNGLVCYLLPAGWEGQYSTAVMADGPEHRR